MQEEGLPGMARTGSVATKAGASGGSRTVWSFGLCMPDTSLASILLQDIPADVRYPVSAFKQQTPGVQQEPDSSWLLLHPV